MIRTLTCLLLLSLIVNADAQTVEPTYKLYLTNSASGGSLTLTKTPMWPYPYVSIGTSPGEAPIVVLTRLAAALKGCDACDEYFPYSGSVDVSENALLIPADAVFGPNRFKFGSTGAPCGSHVMGGTEHGLGIPAAPLAVSARKVSSHEVMLDWENADADYDNIAIVFNSMTWDILPGDTTWYIHDLEGLNLVGAPLQLTNNLIYYLVACRGGTPSNGAGIRLREGHKQECMMATSFSAGLCPTFESWSFATTNGSVVYAEGSHPGVYPNTDIEALGSQAFYQTIEGEGNVTAGVWRKLLVLTPGKYYRVGARINTLQIGQGDWAFSFHAACGPEDGGNLSSAQMAGSAPLPDGSSGLNAGRILCFNSTTNTAGAWLTRDSDMAGFGNAVGNVLIPTNSIGTLVVWFRLTGSNLLSTAVAFDSVTVEEVANQ